MAIRGAGALLFSTLVFATACTAVLGVDDVPNPPGVDAGPTNNVDASIPDTGSSGNVADTGSADTGPQVDPMQAAIAAYATAFCAKYRECERVFFDLAYGSNEECETATAATPKTLITLPGVTVTAKDYQDCATKAAALTCAVYGTAEANLTCFLKGSRKTTDKCLYGPQCESGICDSDVKTCRTCVAAPDIGQPCTTNGSCSPGLVCSGNNVCKTPAKLDEGCSTTTQPCDSGLVCNGTKCVAPPAAAGDPCTADIGCDLLHGFFCNSNGNTCVSVVGSGPGGECTTTATAGATITLCRRFATCSSTDSKCAQPPDEGGDCTSSTNCLAPLRCIDSKCQKPPPSSFCE